MKNDVIVHNFNNVICVRPGLHQPPPALFRHPIRRIQLQPLRLDVWVRTPVNKFLDDIYETG